MCSQYLHGSIDLVIVTVMDATFLRWDLTISTKKIKVTVVGRNIASQSAQPVVELCGEQLEVVSHSHILGQDIHLQLHIGC